MAASQQQNRSLAARLWLPGNLLGAGIVFLTAMLPGLGLSHCVAGLPDSSALENVFLVAPFVRRETTTGPGSTLPTITSVSSPYGNQFNTYIANDGINRFSASGAACIATAQYGYGGCIHGALQRRIQLTNTSSCTNVTAADSLALMVWGCVESSGSPEIVSLGFAPGFGLKEAIDFSSGTWKSLTVTINTDAGSVTTDPMQLWTNPIVKDLVGGVTIDLNTAGTVYIFSASQDKDINILADQIAVVGQGGFYLRGDPGAGGISINASNRNYVWIENFVINAAADNTAIQFQNTKYSVINGVAIQSSASRSIYLQNSDSNLIQYVRIANWQAVGGIELNNSKANTLSNVYLSNGQGPGLYLNNTSDFNTLMLVSVHSTINGISIDGSHSNLLLAGNAVNISGAAAIQLNGATYNTIANTAAINGATGFSMLGNANRNSIVHVVAAHSGVGYDFNNSSNNFYLGILAKGNNTSDCAVVGGVLPGLTAACAAEGPSIIVPVPVVSLINDYYGKIIVDDTANSSDANGSATCNTITDWLGMESLLRGWGQDGALFLNSTTRGPGIGAAACRIYDFNMKNTVSVVRGNVPQPTDGNVAMPLYRNVGNSADCLKHAGASWIGNACSLPGYNTQALCEGAGGDWTTLNKCVQVGLRGAIEVLNDSYGNENGLCESYEICQYAPNLGAYQGHGTYQAVGLIPDGIIKSVYLVRYTSNGY
ncbi:MAG: hypothetical protein KDK39_02490 [Leptospiraceae bacterium]|nr:hypothetical protein [Leptospiraceae bacterium]